MAWNGVNFSVEEAMSQNEAKLKNLSEIEAFIVGDVNDQAYTGPQKVADVNIKVDNYPVAKVAGGDQVSFSLSKLSHNSSHEVTAYVFDEIVIDGSTQKEIGWFGTDAITALEDLESEDAYFVNKNKIRAFEIISKNGSVVSITEEMSITVENKPSGITSDSGQTITYKVQDGEHTQKLFVYDYVEDLNTSFVGWNGHDYIMPISDINNDDTYYVNQGEVEAFVLTQTGKEITSTPTISTEITVSNKPTAVTGKTAHEVTYAVSNSTFTRDVYVFDQVDQKGQGSPNPYQIGWLGHNFILQIDEVSDRELIKQLSEVEAYTFKKDYVLNQIDDSEVEITDLRAELTGIQGQDAVFTTDDKDFIRTAFIFDVVERSHEEAMDAHDFRIALEDVNEANFKMESDVRAYDVSDDTHVKEIDGAEISLETELPETTGTHDFVFATTSGTKIQRRVEVYDAHSVSDDQKEHLFANNFEISILDINDETVKEYSNLTGVIKENNSETLIDVEDLNIVGELPTTVGTFLVTFSSETGTEVTVSMRVIGEVLIEANDIEMSKEEFTKLKNEGNLEATILNRSKAQVLIVETGEYVQGVKLIKETFETLEVSYGQSYELGLSYTLPDTRERNHDVEEIKATLNLKISDQILEPEVPTGLENYFVMYLSMMIASLFLLIIVLRKKRARI